MNPDQRAFIDLLVEYQVLRFGTFTLKSGRTSPYFINAGQLRTGDAMGRLGEAYAARLRAAQIPCDMIFGPSYKGVPLAVATATAMARAGHDVGFSFDRKETKDHGEGGRFVGTLPQDGQHVVIVDDVITSGRSIRESALMLRQAAKVTIEAVLIAVDRQERGRGDRSTLRELEDELSLRVIPMVTVRQIIDDLHGRAVGGAVPLDDAKRAAMERYLAQHCAPAPS